MNNVHFQIGDIKKALSKFSRDRRKRIISLKRQNRIYLNTSSQVSTAIPLTDISNGSSIAHAHGQNNDSSTAKRKYTASTSRPRKNKVSAGSNINQSVYSEVINSNTPNNTEEHVTIVSRHLPPIQGSRLDFDGVSNDETGDTEYPSAGSPGDEFNQLHRCLLYDEAECELCLDSANRIKHFRSEDSSTHVDPDLVDEIKVMVDTYNEIAKKFRQVRDHVEQGGTPNFSIRLFGKRSRDARMHNLPTCDEVAALIIGDQTDMENGRDIIVRNSSGEFKRLYETEPYFMPLQYPLLFPRGEDGFSPYIPFSTVNKPDKVHKRTSIAIREFIAFRIMDRTVEYGNIVNSRRLFQQFVVDCYTMIESQRLTFIRNNQKSIRCDMLTGLQEALSRGETDASNVGRKIILPPSFTGGNRYMFNNCQDAMAICKKFGYPDLFVTITCNSNWREIQDFVKQRNLTASDRPDIVSRVFKMKLDRLMADFKKEELFGKVDAGMYTVEFQKRGLPHAHILIWLSSNNNLKKVDDIDRIISAELPDSKLYPRLADVVSSYMMHGPCGGARLSSPCIDGVRCTKIFPKAFKQTTTIDDEGYPRYRRRDTGIEIEKQGVYLDNRYVVPYNPYLLIKYAGHVNVEYCNKSNSIKYLFKYVNKGPDRATMQVSVDSQGHDKEKPVDEIKQYYDCRYVSPCEAVWRILAFDIHQKWPPVLKLTYHLHNEQTILYEGSHDMNSIVNYNEGKSTMFLAWFEANRVYEEGRDLTYAEFPERFTYVKDEKTWQPRQQGYCIGRLHYTPPGVGEMYYMRILLTQQRGCKGYKCLKTVKGHTYDTFQEACDALDLLDDDKEFIDGITESSLLGSGHQLRRFFVFLLTNSTMTSAKDVWEATWHLLSDGILHSRRRELKIPDLQISENDLKNLCLIEIEKLLILNGKTLENYKSMPQPDRTGMPTYNNMFIVDALNYDKTELAKTHDSLLSMLTSEQRDAYDKIMESVLSGYGRFFFLYGYGGTGKTFIWKTLSAAVRSKGLIVLNAASSGIASLLLPGGKTAHSSFGIPIEINELSTSNFKKDSLQAELISEAKLIIWDEAPMMNKLCFECVDRFLRDIMEKKHPLNKYKPFGGITVVLGGDFRQILPVIRRGSRQDIVSSAINSSKLWAHCTVMRLNVNMRLGASSIPAEQKEIADFGKWILSIGDGDDNADGDGQSNIKVPEDLLITDTTNPLMSLVDFVYPNFLDNINNPQFFQERGILAPTLESVEYVNDYLMSLIPGDEREFLSSDSCVRSDENSEIQGDWFTTEFLNDIKVSGIPNHKLKLKV
ncbi:unnamed protein product [Trifolium pratense]|uniref:Uncharacterized protein n=1 Tax=Trifolium pratense TaxID=57577 RepID=A0ACB0L0U1_TRIPR|nr:unnamed protein product [Trifolium pratense]